MFPASDNRILVDHMSYQTLHPNITTHYHTLPHTTPTTNTDPLTVLHGGNDRDVKFTRGQHFVGNAVSCSIWKGDRAKSSDIIILCVVPVLEAT